MSVKESTKVKYLKIAKDLNDEAGFLERCFFGCCVERYAYSPVVGAMRDGASAIKELCKQIKD